MDFSPVGGRSKKSEPSPYLRKEFRLDKSIAPARFYISSHGLYQAEINGQRVGDQEFTPGWTSYDTRLQYQTYDVTGTLKQGENAIGIILGDGWFRGNLGWGDNRNTWGAELAAIAQMMVNYTDGTTDVIRPTIAGRQARVPSLNLISIMVKSMMPTWNWGDGAARVLMIRHWEQYRSWRYPKRS